MAAVARVAKPITRNHGNPGFGGPAVPRRMKTLESSPPNARINQGSRGTAMEESPLPSKTGNLP
jgi:hypothetical protein